MTQMVAIGGEVGIVNLIGNHECIKTPPSLFNEDETMRAAGTNASPVKVLREETGVRAVPNLTQHNLKTAVVVDASNVRCSSLVLPQRRNLRRSRKALQEPSAD